MVTVGRPSLMQVLHVDRPERRLMRGWRACFIGKACKAGHS